MSFMKHIGKHGDRKVAIMYRKVPGEEHMALVIYPDTLPAAWHDAVMKVIESAPGQEATELSDAMDRSLLPDGSQMLQTLHFEGKIKKVRTNQIIITPNASSNVHLDELNKIVDGIEDGGDAAKKMKEFDVNAGLVDPIEAAQNKAEINAAGDDVMGDDALAEQMLSQSKQMVVEGTALVLESKRLEKEAFKLNPALKPKRTVKKKKVAKKKATKTS